MMRSRAAFTLIEVLVVLTLLAITAAAAIPAFAASRHDPEQAAADSVAILASSARTAARESGKAAELVLSSHRFWLIANGDGLTGTLPLASGQHVDVRADERRTCVFHPNGSATPCTFEFRGRVRIAVHVDLWSGAIRIDRPDR